MEDSIGIKAENVSKLLEKYMQAIKMEAIKPFYILYSKFYIRYSIFLHIEQGYELLTTNYEQLTTKKASDTN